MCLAMCLKKQEFQADCVYKLGVYKKKCVPKGSGGHCTKLLVGGVYIDKFTWHKDVSGG